ncbi:hypothetical protein REJC140_01385 [Pseudorhizobium endolithicum]|uniref:Uncharacterized protein n=1 Tax=Pseudorhizobium endolithicum TaxID=1191678 RepID=A0ABM8PU10_9HYPH|nr:hypothetical protein [Pseudorhizobium endolithicum]CAD7048475.1 hypothetical protein REJC140_01385 [Pseudorhizobium endolithicum]
MAFLIEVHPEPARLSVGVGTDSPGSPIANGRYLLGPTVRRIERVMIRRRLSPGALMAEIGFEGTGGRLAKALHKGASLRLAIIAALEEWLPEQERQLEQDMQKPSTRTDCPSA